MEWRERERKIETEWRERERRDKGREKEKGGRRKIDTARQSESTMSE